MSTEALLSSLKLSVETAATALPDENTITPPQDGISLLDVKNELLLSYLQNLVFLIVLRLRERHESEQGLRDEVVRKLVELRLYIEKGVRPLEKRLKYQIDKVVRAADDSLRASAQNKRRSGSSGNDQGRAQDDESGSEVAEAEVDPLAQAADDIDELSYRPNPAAFLRSHTANPPTKEASKDGIYKPPRIAPTALPTTQGREAKAARRPVKSAALDDFIATEVAEGAIAEPSIGTGGTIAAGGRRVRSARELQDEAERRAHEEANFVRLPKESKKERTKKRGRPGASVWGGEEWRDLGAGLDRIERLTARKGGSSNVLEKSRKRSVQDGPRGSGLDPGHTVERRRKAPKHGR